MKPKFIQSVLVIHYDVDRNIVNSSVGEFQNKLQAHFKSPFFVANNLPEGANPTITRFQSQSLNGHSQLQVAQNKVTITTNYDKAYENDLNLIIDYLKQKVASILPILENRNVNFWGIVMRTFYDYNLNELLPFIRRTTNASFLTPEVINFNYSYAKRFKNNYYLNIGIKRTEQINVKVNVHTNQQVKTNMNGLSIDIDFNNRYLFDTGKKTSLNENIEFFDELKLLILNNTIENFTTGAV